MRKSSVLVFTLLLFQSQVMIAQGSFHQEFDSDVAVPEGFKTNRTSYSAIMDELQSSRSPVSEEQLAQLEEAEELMEKMDLSGAEEILLSMLVSAKDCVPVLSNLGHLYGKHLSEFEIAVEYYDRVLEIEPDNPWARDARRRYSRYIGRD